MLFEPVVGVALAAWLLDEALAPIQIVGAAAILGAAVLLQRARPGGDEGRVRPGRSPPTALDRRPGRPVDGAPPMPDGPIRVLIVDDHAMVRGDARLPRRCTTTSRSSARRPTAPRPSIEADELRPDVVVMDLLMPDLDGIEATARIKAAHPTSRSWR